MIDEEILELRRKLNESVINENNYEKTYRLSIELDNLITQYYKKKLKKGWYFYKTKKWRCIVCFYFFCYPLKINILKVNLKKYLQNLIYHVKI